VGLAESVFLNEFQPSILRRPAPARREAKFVLSHECTHALKRVLRACVGGRMPAAEGLYFGIFRLQRVVEPARCCSRGHALASHPHRTFRSAHATTMCSPAQLARAIRCVDDARPGDSGKCGRADDGAVIALLHRQARRISRLRVHAGLQLVLLVQLLCRRSAVRVLNFSRLRQGAVVVGPETARTLETAPLRCASFGPSRRAWSRRLRRLSEEPTRRSDE